MAVKRHWQRLTGLDRAIVVISVAACVALFFVIGFRPPGKSVVVMQENKVVFRAPLNRNRTVDLPGPLGATRLVIEERKARVAASPCPYKICIGMGSISRRGEIIACVPNRLVVQIDGTAADREEKDYDLLSR